MLHNIDMNGIRARADYEHLAANPLADDVLVLLDEIERLDAVKTLHYDAKVANARWGQDEQNRRRKVEDRLERARVAINEPEADEWDAVERIIPKTAAILNEELGPIPGTAYTHAHYIGGKIVRSQGHDGDCPGA